MVRAQEPAHHVAVVDNLIHYAFGEVHRDSKAYALIAATPGKDRGIDSDELTLCIDERAAGIARIDGRVGLDEVFVVLDTEVRPAGGADDSHGHGLADAKGITNRKSEITDLNFGRIAKGDGGQVVRINLQNGNVRLGIAANDLGGEFALVAQRNFNVRGAIDNVIVGQNVSIGGDDYAGPQSLFFFLLGLLMGVRLPVTVTKKTGGGTDRQTKG